jgi:ribosomal protein S18 acetylase RimI-like enzyme
MHIKPISDANYAELLRIAVDTGLFSADEAQTLLGGVLQELADGALPEGHQAAACWEQNGGSPVGWCYFAPDDHAANVWNLWWIGVSPRRHGAGVGLTLLRYVEQEVRNAGGRLLIIETSDAEPLSRARRFYVRNGYAECGRIPDFYAVGEAKVVFARTLGGD